MNCASFQQALLIIWYGSQHRIGLSAGRETPRDPLLQLLRSSFLPSTWLPHCFITDDGERLSATQWTRGGFCVTFPGRRDFGGASGPRECTWAGWGSLLRNTATTLATRATAVARQDPYHVSLRFELEASEENVCKSRLKHFEAGQPPGLWAAGNDGFSIQRQSIYVDVGTLRNVVQKSQST